MRKILGITISAIGIVITVLGLILQVKGQMAVSIIGGTDGPTSVFFAGIVGGPSSVTGIIAGIVLFVVGIFIIAGKKSNPSLQELQPAQMKHHSEKDDKPARI